MSEWQLISGDPSGEVYGKPGAYEITVGATRAQVTAICDTFMLHNARGLPSSLNFYVHAHIDEKRQCDGAEVSFKATADLPHPKNKFTTLEGAKRVAEQLARDLDRWHRP